ncbi:tetratricopeptide repeat protein [Oxalobacteraceae sp. CFBP 8761]|nr:tetratricopeptide repeat protein [Oxalobacteraceae sp. CFBP 8761]
MTTRTVTCSSCGKNQQVPADLIAAHCMYCGQTVTIQGLTQVSMGPALENLLGMARTAESSNNVDEAVAYYNRVLEMNPNLAEAWIGKGRAAGFQSTLAHLRINESVVAFNHAIANTPVQQRDHVIDTCVAETNGLVATIYGMSVDQAHQFAAVDGQWADHIGRVTQLLQALETVRAWRPDDKNTLENIVTLCSQLIEGVQYVGFDQVPKANFLVPQFEQEIRDQMLSVANRLAELNPDFVIPNPVAKKPASACFVVAAAMGSEDHPTVETLRQFRDRWLNKRSLGRGFISFYYRRAPAAADYIRHRKLARAVAYAILVAPAAAVARVILSSIRR